MTEADMKTKWCPFGRGPDLTVAVNRLPDGSASPTTLCLASECGCWRWTANSNKTDGFCGLAGLGGTVAT